jgi:hypothetical protein
VTLFVGVFMPIVSLPFVGAQNFFQNGRGDGTILIAIAGVALLATLARRYALVAAMGIVSLALLAFTFVNFQSRISEIRASVERDLAGNPFRGLGDMMLQSVQLQWGWSVLVLGSALLIAAAVRERDSNEAGRILPSAVAALVILTLIAGGAVITAQVSRATAQQKEASQREAAEREHRNKREREEREKAEAVNRLRLQNYDWKYEGYSTYLAGAVRNESTRPFRFVRVEFSLLDKNKNLVGTASDSIMSLEPGETWRFRAHVFDRGDVKSARLRELKGTPE